MDGNTVLSVTVHFCIRSKGCIAVWWPICDGQLPPVTSFESVSKVILVWLGHVSVHVPENNRPVPV